MAIKDSAGAKTVFWTSLIVTIPATVINQLFVLLNKSVNARAYELLGNHFTRSQPDYYPLLFMFIMFFAVLAVTAVYSMIYSRLTGHWITRGIYIGLFLFLVAGLPYAVHTGYTTVMLLSYAWSGAFFGLVGYVVNGCLIAYVYSKLVDHGKKKK
jgi:cellobiose-specific phosphotransferase system component IIC